LKGSELGESERQVSGREKERRVETQKKDQTFPSRGRLEVTKQIISGKKEKRSRREKRVSS